MLAALAAVYFYGALISLYVYMCRAVGRLASPLSFAAIFMHEPSRRQGIPWLISAIGKAVGWPVVLQRWLSAGRPPSSVLIDQAAAMKLGIDPDSLDYHTRGFGTVWKA